MFQGWQKTEYGFPPTKKDFTRLDNNCILKSAINQARHTGQELCVAWLDLANALPSVPHNYIFGTLTFLLPAELIAAIRDLYKDTPHGG
jgi:hypothetical protein